MEPAEEAHQGRLVQQEQQELQVPQEPPADIKQEIPVGHPIKLELAISLEQVINLERAINLELAINRVPLINRVPRISQELATNQLMEITRVKARIKDREAVQDKELQDMGHHISIEEQVETIDVNDSHII